jgi:hypothetical protein
MCDREALLSRRQLLRAAGLAAAASAVPVATARAWAAPGSETVTLTATVAGTGTYAYLPFEVPPGVNRVAARLEKEHAEAALGFGLFDHRGPEYQSPGFRGIYGAERAEFEVAADAASASFLPGPIEPGTWTIIVPVFQAPRPTRITVTVTLTYGRQPRLFRLRPAPTLVDPQPGWYRGDLHCHTPESSDAWASGSALDPAGWARTCRDLGLDFAALTDHNVVSQNLHLAAATVPGILLLAGEEMTNWFHGHATVSGLSDPTGWLDWRQRPAGVPLQEHEERLPAFLAAAGELDAFVSAAHPFFAHLSWQFLTEAAADPTARTHGIEIWTGQFTPDCEVALEAWDGMLRDGQRIVANGGSDLHGTENDLGFVAGTPTTVVYADALERGAIVRALRAGRSFVTRLPDGVEIYLTAVGPGDQRRIVGGSVHGDAGDVVHVEALVRKGAGAVCTLVANGVEARQELLTSDEQVVALDLPIGAGGYVRAEVRRSPTTDPAAPLSGHTGMEAFTNPIWLVNGPPPEDDDPTDAPPPERPDASPAPPGPPAEGTGPGSRSLPATGGGTAALGALGIAGAAAIGGRRRA